MHKKLSMKIKIMAKLNKKPNNNLSNNSKSEENFSLLNNTK